MFLKEEPYKELGRIRNPKFKNGNHQDNKIEESAGVWGSLLSLDLQLEPPKYTC